MSYIIASSTKYTAMIELRDGNEELREYINNFKDNTEVMENMYRTNYE
jgi:hypothetical protein